VKELVAKLLNASVARTSLAGGPDELEGIVNEQENEPRLSVCGVEGTVATTFPANLKVI
jgi:hypothetical protein